MPRMPLDLEAALAGPPPHPNCRCSACEPLPFVKRGVPAPLRITTVDEARDMLYGVPVLKHPLTFISLAEGAQAPGPFAPPADEAQAIARAEVDLSFQLGRHHRVEVDAGDFTGALGAPGGPTACDVQFNFKDTLSEMVDKSLGLDLAVVREATRRAAQAVEEQVRYTMVTGEAPPATATAAEVKAATDYYLATGRLPGAPAPAPAPRPRPATPPATHRRAMKLTGKLR
jgi:hypothetical protein